MGTEHPRVLVTMDLALLEAVTSAAAAVGVSRAEWIRGTCRAALGVQPPIGDRVVSARVMPRGSGKAQQHARLVAETVLPRDLATEPFEEGA